MLLHAAGKFFRFQIEIVVSPPADETLAVIFFRPDRIQAEFQAQEIIEYGHGFPRILQDGYAFSGITHDGGLPVFVCQQSIFPLLTLFIQILRFFFRLLARVLLLLYIYFTFLFFSLSHFCNRNPRF